MDVDRLLLVLITIKNFPIDFAEIGLFFTFQTKSSLFTPVHIFFTISQILKTKFNVFWTKSCRNLE